MPTLQELMEHRPDPRIGRVNDYLDRGKRLAQALYQGFLSSIPQPQSGDVLVDDQGNWHGGQLPEETAYNTLAWLMPTGSVSEAAQFAKEGFNPSTLRAITAYHGSPHKFDKFDMSKIGTGEGAQAYGHGLYFAESPDVAGQYQRNLSGYAEVDGKKLSGGIADRNASPERLAEILLAPVQNEQDFARAYETAKSWRGGVAADVIDKWLASGKLKYGDNGNLYKTSLEWPDPAREAADPLGPQHFLDWDKPLSEQPGSVNSALKSMVNDVVSGGFNLSRGNRDITKAFNPVTKDQVISEILQEYPKLSYKNGHLFSESGAQIDDRAIDDWMKNKHGIGYQDAGSLYHDLAHIVGSDMDISATLRNHGVPGIRYLDGGSRGAGDGTYNYVVFDDQIPRITERNGVTLEDLFRR